MGIRANLAIIERERRTDYQLYYCHWCAATLEYDLFWGPEYALPFIQQQEPIGRDEWMGTTWAEGGVLMDTYRKRLLWFGGDDFTYEILLRQLHLTLMRNLWPGWDVQYAHAGNTDLMNYIGMPHAGITGTQYEEEKKPVKHWPLPAWLRASPQSVRSAASLIFADGTLGFYPLPAISDSRLLREGPRIVKLAPRENALPQLNLAEWMLPDALPTQGFHLDVPEKRLYFWNAYAPALYDELRQTWQGWDVVWWKDEFEHHEDQVQPLGAGPRLLTFPRVPDEVLLARLEQRLFTPHYDYAKSFRKIDRGLDKEGYTGGFSASSGPRNAPLALDLETRRDLFNDAVRRWRNGTSK